VNRQYMWISLSKSMQRPANGKAIGVGANIRNGELMEFGENL